MRVFLSHARHLQCLSRILRPLAFSFALLLLPPLTAFAAESGFTGMEIQAADQGLRQAVGLKDGHGGIIIRDIMPGSPSEQAGLQRGDILTDFDGVSIQSLNQLVAYMQGTKPGQTVAFTRWHSGKSNPQTIALSSWPAGWDIRTNAAAVVPRLGLTLVALTPEVRENAGLRWGRTGVLIRSLDSNAPAIKWGLEAGDLIVSVGRQLISNPADVDQLLARMGNHWYLLVERDNQVFLAGPSMDKAPVVATSTILAAKLADGPFVMDVATTSYPGSTNTTPLPSRAGTLPAMPSPLPSPADQEQALDHLGLSVATLTDARRKDMRLRWSSQGLVVTRVEAGSLAHQAGLAPGHVIWSVNQSAPPSIAHITTALQAPATDDRSAANAALLVEARNGFFLVTLPLRDTQAGTLTDANPLARFMDDGTKGQTTP